MSTSDAVDVMLPGCSNKSDDHEPLLLTTQSPGLGISFKYVPFGLYMYHIYLEEFPV